MVLIVHNYNGRLVFSQYAHLSGYAVGTNQDVYAGQIIGYVGQTGRATGPHLHYEAWYGGAPFAGGSRFNPFELYN